MGFSIKQDLNDERLEITFDADQLLASLATSRNATTQGMKPQISGKLVEVGHVAVD
jgi:hypothetical protein